MFQASSTTAPRKSPNLRQGPDPSATTRALQAAIDHTSSEGGGVVCIPPGIWECGSLILRSDITLHLEKNAVLRACGEAGLFPHFHHSTWSRMDLFPWRSFLFGADLENVSIEGEGVIECGGQHAVFQDKIGNSPDRPYGIHLVNCRNVRISGVGLRNSGHWMLRLLECRDVRITGIEIFNHCNANNDGIDIDSCAGVIISDCRVDSSDDGICLKSEGASPCRDVVVSNCLVSSHASALKLGTGSNGGFLNVCFSNCVVRPSRSSEMHHPMGFWKGLSGIDIGGVDGGETSGILFSNIAMEGPANPVIVRLGNRLSRVLIPENRRPEDAKPSPASDGVAGMSGIRIAGLTAREVGPWPTIIAGIEGQPIKDITLRDWNICYSVPPDPARASVPANWDPSIYPCAWSVAGWGESDLPASQFALRHIDGLLMDNVRVTSAPGDPRPASEERDVRHIAGPTCRSGNHPPGSSPS